MYGQERDRRKYIQRVERKVQKGILFPSRSRQEGITDDISFTITSSDYNVVDGWSICGNWERFRIDWCSSHRRQTAKESSAVHSDSAWCDFPATFENWNDQAGLKVWVLTGDKLETAVNIAKTANLINPDEMNVVTIRKDRWKFTSFSRTRNIYSSSTKGNLHLENENRLISKNTEWFISIYSDIFPVETPLNRSIRPKNNWAEVLRTEKRTPSL